MTSINCDFEHTEYEDDMNVNKQSAKNKTSSNMTVVYAKAFTRVDCDDNITRYGKINHEHDLKDKLVLSIQYY